MSLKLLPPGSRKANPFFIVVGWWNGRPFERSLKTKDPDEAQLRYHELMVELGRQKASGAVRFTFADAAALYKEVARPSERWAKEIDAVMEIFGRREAASIRNEDISRAALKLYPRAMNSTRNRNVLVPVAAVLHFAAKDNRIPWLRVQKFKEETPEPRPVNCDVAETIINSATGMKRVFLLFLFRHGWRVSEALELCWDWIDLGARTTRRHIRKTNRWDTIPLADDVREALCAEVPPERRVGRVFSWGDRHNVYRWLKPHCKKLGIRFTPHMARHSFATWAVNAGADTQALMELGGWQSLKSIQRYAKVSQERIRQVLDRVHGGIHGK